jgi:transglutaminase-like putative cysteine protease
MKYQVRHRTTYRYGTPVEMAAHLLHLRPRDFAFQRVVAAEVVSVPAAIRESEGIDHFGNRVRRIFIDERHARFEVTAEALVEVEFPLPPAPAVTLPWEEVVVASRAGEAVEFTFASPLVPILAAAREYAAPSFPPGQKVLAGLLDLTSRIRREFAFRPGVTTVSTPVEELLQRREGVCQDFSHLMIAALRSLGLPGRYVSGYIRTHPAPGTTGLRGADQSHAWVAAWQGPAHGWIDLDPTNDLVVRDEHVVLAWGRDFGDVSPVRGVILGGGRHSLAVAVELAPC